MHSVLFLTDLKYGPFVAYQSPKRRKTAAFTAALVSGKFTKSQILTLINQTHLDLKYWLTIFIKEFKNKQTTNFELH